ncbi:MAG TPA: adenylate cyclase regulatory domain-containing protein [Solirubrobacteraceae bacterium]|nr:adenylate cyclase regulatory domain-containing protein [Solirubrobacteraceae bacterium]
MDEPPDPNASDGKWRAGRQELVQRLERDGVPSAEVERHAQQGTLFYLAAERAISSIERFTVEDVARRAGVDVDFILAARRALALPISESATYVSADVEAVRIAALAGRAGISPEEMVELLRALARGLKPAAEVARALVLRLALTPRMTEAELADAYGAVAEELHGLLTPLVTNLLTLYLREIPETEAISAAHLTAGRLTGARRIAVCFVDLVGYTRIGEHTEPRALADLSLELEAIVQASIYNPVQLVKTIGDATMLISPEDDTLLDIALDVQRAVSERGGDFPPVRVGVATGDALLRGGDWFGPPVNLASRITAIARPDSILVHDATRRAARSERFRWSYVGTRRIRGLSAPVALYRLRRAEHR